MKSGVTKRTIDYYSNIGLLVVNRSESNYRFYDKSMIERIHWIEQKKAEGKSLDEIKRLLFVPDFEEIDVQSLRLQMLELEQKVSILLEHKTEQERQQIRKKVSPESLALMQSLLFLIP